MTAHQLLHKVNFDQCAFCCGTPCKLAVDVLDHDVWNLVNYMAKHYDGRLRKEGNKNMIDLLWPSTMVCPNCLVFPKIAPFKYLACNNMAKDYTALNMPYKCHWCNIFIWSYNIRSYYERLHPNVWAEDQNRSGGYMNWKAEGDETERSYVLEKFNKKNRSKKRTTGSISNSEA